MTPLSSYFSHFAEIAGAFERREIDPALQDLNKIKEAHSCSRKAASDPDPTKKLALTYVWAHLEKILDGSWGIYCPVFSPGIISIGNLRDRVILMESLKKTEDLLYLAKGILSQVNKELAEEERSLQKSCLLRMKENLEDIQKVLNYPSEIPFLKNEILSLDLERPPTYLSKFSSPKDILFREKLLACREKIIEMQEALSGFNFQEEERDLQDLLDRTEIEKDIAQLKKEAMEKPSAGELTARAALIRTKIFEKMDKLEQDRSPNNYAINKSLERQHEALQGVEDLILLYEVN